MSTSSNSGNSTSLYGEVGTPIPDSNNNVIVRGDLWVLSGNILTTATTGNIFPANATTINLGNAATTVNIGANTGTTTINNNLSVDGTGTFAGDITATGGDFGNITVGITTNNTIDTTTGDLLLSAAGGEIGLISVGTLYTDQSSFLLLNSPTTVTAFDSATSLTMGETTGTTTIRNDLSVQGTGTFTGDVTATGGDFGNINIAITNNNTINSTSGGLALTSFDGSIGLVGSGTLYTDQSTFLLLNSPTTVTAFDSATTLNLGDVTGTTFIRNDTTVGGDLKINGNTIKSNGGTTAITLNVDDVTIADDLYVNGVLYSDNIKPVGTYLNVASLTNKAYIQLGETVGYPNGYMDFLVNSNQWSLLADGRTQFPNYIFPAADGTANQVLTTDGSGNVSWALPGGGGSTFGNITVAIVDDNTISTTTGNLKLQSFTGDLELAADTGFLYPEGGSAFNRPYFQSTTGNSSGVRAVAPNTGTSSSAALSALNSSDAQNAELISIQSFGSAITDPLRIVTGKYTAGVFGASSKSIAFRDGTTTYATTNPAGPSASTDLTTVSYVAGVLPTVVTYDYNATSTTGGANLNLVGSNATTDTVKLTDGGHITATYTSGTVVTLGSDATDANTASTIVARDASGNFSAGTITATLSGTATQVSNSLTAGTHLSGGPFNGSSAVTLTTDATDANTANTIVSRDASGNFAASGATLGNVTVGVDTDQTISTSSGNLVLQTAAGVNSGTITINAGAAGNIAIAPDTTGDIHLNSDAIRIGDNNATATLATRGTGNLVLTTNEGSIVEGTITIANGANGNITLAPNGTGIVSSGLTHVATASRALGQMYGTQSTTWTPPATGQTTMTGQNGFYASSSSGGANGFGSTIQSRYYSGDTTLGTSTTATFLGGAATGTNAAPGALGSGQVLMSLNADAYATTGWASTIATGTQTPTGIAIAPAQLQFYSREAFADNGTNVTAGGTGMRVRLFNAATTYTAANRVNIIDHTTTTATYKAATFNIQPAASTSNYAVFAPTTGSINQDTFTIKNNAATSTQATFTSTGASFGSGSSTYASFTSSSSSIGYVDSTVLLDRTTAGTPGIANQKNAFTIESRRSDQSGVTDADSTGNAFRVGGTGNFYWTNQVQSQYDTSGVHEYTIQAADGDQTSGSPTWLSLTTFTPTSTVIRAGTAGSGGATAAKLTVDAAKITAAVPVVFPSYTVAAAGAITGAAGWQISISNSTGNGGRMAYWDTTNARWNYVSDDTAI